MNPKKLDSSVKSLIMFIAMLIIGGIAMVAYVCYTGNNNQTFTDVVIEYTSRYGMNKSAERTLFYIFPLLGGITYAFFYFKGKWYSDSSTTRETKASNYVFVALLVSFCVNYLIYQKISSLVFGAIIVSVAARLKSERDTVNACALYFIVVYGLLGIYRFYVFAGGMSSVGLTSLAVVSIAISILVVLLPGSDKNVLRGIMIGQIAIPFLLLMYLMSSYYTSDGNVTNISTPRRVQALIWLIVVAFMAEAIYRLVKSWALVSCLTDSLSFGACVSIMAFNRFSGTGCIADLDLHHNFENVIGYSQIFELGQKPFVEYIPVSGMYSILQGWFLKFFGKGYGGYYYLTANLFYLAVIFIIVFLLRRQLKAEWVLFISLFFWVTDYNRITLIVPIILLLTWPALIEKRNLWLMAWFLTSFVHGLYYPVFGAAVCVAFLPLGIWQVYSYAKSGALKNDIKTAKFWIGWIICLLPAVAGVKLLVGTAKHMLAMGSQTIYADGITRFGQVILGNFVSYISSWTIRLIIYYLFSYVIIVAIVWLSVVLLLRCGEAKFEDKRLSISNPQAGLIAISVGLMLLVSFSYTVVRFDVGDLYSRSDGVVKAAFVVFVIIIARYFKGPKQSGLWLLAFSVFILSVVSAEGFMNVDADNKLDAYYTVPENDIYVIDTDVRLGECFIDADSYEYISNVNAYIKTLDTEKSYLGLVDSFGLDYLCNVKGSSVIEIFNTIKGYGATEETIEVLREHGSIVGRNINPDSNYYLYHWLVTSGEYIWNDDIRVFVPNDGSLTKEEVQELHKNIDLSYSDGVPLARTAGSWGSSFDSLKDIFTNIQLGYSITPQTEGINISFDRSIDGDEADFIYIDFGDLTTNYGYMQMDGTASYPVEVGNDGIAKMLLKKDYNPGVEINLIWFNEAGAKYSISCNLDEGKLLIPVGSGTGWLLNNHSDISITATYYGEAIELPEIKEIQFLKLREAN